MILGLQMNYYNIFLRGDILVPFLVEDIRISPQELETTQVQFSAPWSNGS